MSNHALVEAARSAWPFKTHDPLDMGIEHGIVWAITRAPFYGINGYALIPAEGHPWSTGIPETPVVDDDGESYYSNYATDDLSVHGGITYGGSGGGPGWIGFDTAHSGDVWTGEYDTVSIREGETQSEWMGGTSWDRHWTVDLVRAEAKSLARQIAAVSK